MELMLRLGAGGRLIASRTRSRPRFIGTLKREGTTRMLVPYSTEELERRLARFAGWYHTKPHASLSAATPDEVARGLPPPDARARLEVRPRYPIRECHAQRVAALHLVIDCIDDEVGLPVIRRRSTPAYGYGKTCAVRLTRRLRRQFGKQHVGA